MLRNIDNVLQRIAEIKRRFGYIDERLPLKPPRSLQGKPSFQEILKGEISEELKEKEKDVRPKLKGKEYNQPILKDKIYDLIEKYSKKYDLDPALVKAIMKAESNFNPNVISRAGACGLMQLMPQTAAELGVKDIFDIEQNIEGGTRYFKKMLDEFKDVTLALAAYNAGPARVRNKGGVPNILETQQYIKRVLKYYREFKG